MSIKPEVSWSVSWPRKHRMLARRYADRWIKQTRKHERHQAQMDEQTDATFQEVFSQVSLANSIKLLPWCLSSTIPLCYMSGVLATTAQQDGDIPATTAASESEGSPAPGPWSSPAHPPRTPPFPIPPLPDISFVGTPPVWHPFAAFHAIPTEKKWDCYSSGLLDDHCNRRTHVNSQEVKGGSDHSSAQSNEDMPELVPEAGPSFKLQQGWEPTSPLPVQPGPLLVLMMVLQQEAQGLLEIRPHLTQTHHWRMRPTLIWIQPPETASSAQTQTKWPYELLRRNTRRGYELPVGWVKAASGLRFNWKGSVTAARLCGDTTMRAFKESRIVLLQKTANPLRCVGWWSGLTNCSTLQWPLTPKFTPETQRLKPMARGRFWYCNWNNTTPTITISMKTEWLEPWLIFRGCIQVTPLDIPMYFPVWG